MHDVRLRVVYELAAEFAVPVMIHTGDTYEASSKVKFINDPGKLMFGTDWPISGLPSYLHFAETIEATPDELEGLLWRNANRVFKLGLGEARTEASSDGAC